MCICIFKPADVVLAKKVLKKSFNNNPDGAGFAYPSKDGKSIIVDRGYFGFREFWCAYRDLQQGRPMLIHFRIATSGSVDESNCHPWLIDKRHALIHNGNLESKLNCKLENVSDTGVFVETKLKPLFAKFKKKRFWASAPFKWTMEEAIGDSKMVILDASGFEMIYNVERGEWEHGAWFSNDTYKKDRKSIRTVKTTTVDCGNGVIKEIKEFLSGRSITRYIAKANTEEKPQEQNNNTPIGDNFLNELEGYPRIDISEMY